MTYISDITKRVYSGGTPDTRKSEYWNGNIKWLSSGETRNDYIYDTEKKITEMGVKNSSTKLARRGSIVMACAGQGFTRGQTSYLMDDMYINQSVICIEPDEEKVDGLYLYYFFKNNYNYLRSLSDDHSSRGSITTAMIKNIDVDFPNLDEQKKVSNILNSIDKKIEINIKENNCLFEINKNLYKEKIYGIKDNYDDSYYKNLDEIVVTNTRGLSPKYAEKGIPVINQSCIRNNIIQEDKIQFHDLSKSIKNEYFYEPYDILINSMGVGTLGRMSQIGDLKKQYLIHSCITIIRAKEEIISQFVLGQALISRKEDIESMAQGSTGQTSLSNKELGKMKFFIPPMEVQNSISPLIKDNIDKITINLLENDKLIQLRDALLPKLMNGEITIDSIEI